MGTPKLAILASVLCALGPVACSNLTAPPAPEPIQADQPVAAAASGRPPAPSASVLLRPSAQNPAGQNPGANPTPAPAAPEGKLEITDVVTGKGDAVKTGDNISVHYVGTLKDGTKFDSSRDRGTPFDFQVGGRVIDGWNKGVVGMKAGGKRKLVIPWSMAYGERGAPPKIPPRSDLVFEIELLKILPPQPPQ